MKISSPRKATLSVCQELGEVFCSDVKMELGEHRATAATSHTESPGSKSSHNTWPEKIPLTGNVFFFFCEPDQGVMWHRTSCVVE